MTFTAAATDNISFFPPVNTRWLGATAQTGNDVGTDVNDILTDTADMQPKLGTPAGASMSADILVLDNLVDDLESRLGTPSNLGTGATVALTTPLRPLSFRCVFPVTCATSEIELLDWQESNLLPTQRANTLSATLPVSYKSYSFRSRSRRGIPPMAFPAA